MTPSIVKLGDVATYYNGYAFKPSDRSPEGRRIVRIQDLTGSSYETNYFSGQLPDKFAIQRGDVLISWSASLGVYVWNDEPAWLNQHIFRVGFNKLQVNKSFFVHQIDYLLKASSGLAHGATMRHLTKNTFDSLPFRYPDPTEQLRIANVLDKVDLLLHSCSNVLERLDSLIKSRFIEMFGDCSSYTSVALADVCAVFSDGDWIESKDQSDEGIRLIQTGNIGNGVYLDKSSRAKFVSLKTFKELRCTEVFPGDILISRLPDPVGRCCIVPDGLGRSITAVDCSIVRLNSDWDPVFFRWFTQMDAYQAQVKTYLTGTTRQRISRKNLGKALIPRVSLEDQRAFSSFANKVDKLRFDVQQQIEKLETLKKTLMQEYFG